jgi:WXG100 family type VII secretion target
MAATIVVTPELLRHAAAAARALGGRLLEVRGQVSSTLAGADAALGDGEARAAFATLRTHWSASSERLTAAVDELAAALESAADSYERADQEGARLPGPPARPAVTHGHAGGGTRAPAG